MATGTVATAAGAAMLLYFVLSRRMASREGRDDPDDEGSKLNRSGSRRRIARRPAQAPATWFEFLASLSETIRFTYAETLGKWPIGDLAFGINYLIRRQGNVHVASVYTGSGCVQLKGPEVMTELINWQRLLTLCMYFSKKPFPIFLELSGFSLEDVLLQEPKAGFLKPAFTIIRDSSSKCFLLLIRGTHSIKDTLTAATGAVVPFHHLLLHEGGVSNLILGYAHCGMVAAARWIANLTIPCLLKAVDEYPDHKVKIVGHSLGGGTAAILTYILREREQFASSTCIAFAPAACMTWELAESGKHFVTTIINGSDLVPTFSATSVDDLRSEVTSSSWLNDLRDQVERTRFVNIVYRSASAVGSRLPSISTAKARVAGAGALLRPVSSGTQGVVKQARTVAQAVVRSRSSLSSWTCMGARRRSVGPMQNSTEDGAAPNTSLIPRASSDLGQSESIEGPSNSEGLLSPEREEEINVIAGDRDTSRTEEMTEGELWYELEKELHREEDESDVQAREEEAQAAIEIIEDENVVLADAVEAKSTAAAFESYRFYPPGRTMHMVVLPPSETNSDDEDSTEERVGIYETPRHLYGKLRLSRTMINDHYMPMYKKVMERLICELEKGDDVLDDILC